MNEHFRKSEILAILLLIAIVELSLSRFLPSGLLIELPLIFAVYIGWYSTPAMGAFWGACLGLLEDSLLGVTIGVNGFSKTLLGFGAAYGKKWLAPEGYLARLVFLIPISACDSLIIYGLQNLMDEPIRPGFLVDILTRVVMTSLVGALIFNIYDRLKFPPADFQDR